MSIISSTTKSYIAGFLDGDGCILFQLVRRKDYIYGFQIRASIVFYQKTINRHHLEWLKKTLYSIGYIRDRNDGMTEYTIVGFKSVIKILELLKPYIILKKRHVEVALQINKILQGKFSLEKMLKAAKLVDLFGELNYSKRRKNTSVELKNYLKQHKLYPCNDFRPDILN